MPARCPLDDPFAILEVPRDASDDDIKRAYRRLAKAHHPDRHPDDASAAEQFKRIAAAFELLSDPERRAQWLSEQGATGTSWPAAFASTVENAVARAQTYVEEHVLPHYARYLRGARGEAAVRLWRDAESLVDGSFLVEQGPPRPSDRRRAAAWVERIEVAIADWPMAQASHLMPLRRGRYRIVVLPFALWHGGFRQSADVDDLILQLLVTRYAQIWGDRSGALRWVDHPEAIERARAIDDRALRNERGNTLLTAGLAIGVALLVSLGLAGC